MSAVASGLRWVGTLLVDTADELERPVEMLSPPADPAVEVEEELRRMRERVQGRYY